MKTKLRCLKVFIYGAAFLIATNVFAHSGDIIPSPGVSSAIDVTNVGNLAEWTGAGAYDFMIDNTHPNTAHVYVVHQTDGIYMRVEITDGTPNNNDALKIKFDLSHSNGGSTDANDWGIVITRDGITKKWGDETQDSLLWSNIPAGLVGIGTIMDNPWIVEIKLPTGSIPPNNTHTLDVSTDGGNIGAYIQIFNELEMFEPPFATTYNQWPNPIGDVLIDGDPGAWGNYEFDPTTTFADVGVIDIRNNYDGAENYRKISHTALNMFEVRVHNPGGTTQPDAPNTRINLYLAARGIGEPWHRIDQGSVIDGDCAAPGDWPFSLISKNEVCTGTVSLDDIGLKTIDDIVHNTADYTIKLSDQNSGQIERVDGQSETITGGFNDWLSILNWDTTTLQDARFTEIILDGTYRRDHQCMKAEAIVPNDPSTSNNLRQSNMDFVCIPQAAFASYWFTLGWTGFQKYDPDKGKKMFLQMAPKNLSQEIGWEYSLEGKGIDRIDKNVYVANLKGTRSISANLTILGPKRDPLGVAIKENLMVPPKAAGNNPNVEKSSGEKPVYVKVNGGSSVLIANYGFDDHDIQQVDLDGSEDGFPANGVAGLNIKTDDAQSNLLAKHIRPGALVGSFDNFKSAFLIGEGVKVDVPTSATHLALGINDYVGNYSDNSGTGFRVKITQLGGSGIIGTSPFIKTAAAAGIAQVNIVPIQDVMPSLCINGYEDINQKRNVGGTNRNLYRYIGNVCWGFINIFPPDRSKEPDKGDKGPGVDTGGDDRPDNGKGPQIEVWFYWLIIILLIFLLFWCCSRRRQVTTRG